MNPESLKLPSYGGQALIEGVLMRGSKGLAAAYRAPDKKIIVQTEPLKGIYLSKIKSIPFLRGLILLWDGIGLGTRYLTASANIQTGEEEKIEGPEMFFTLLISLALAVLLFFASPAIIGQWVEHFTKWGPWWDNLFEGVLRLIIVIGYIWAVGKMSEIKRVFAYHGAEHKTINAFENGCELTPEKVMKYPLAHPRCGTSFILTLVIISVLFFGLLGPLSPVWRIISRIVFLPLLVGIAYEYIRLMSNHINSRFVKWLMIPNLALQKLTTNEPSLDMLEVSIAAFKAMQEQEKSIQEVPVL